mmetsp:Transcript_9930/g.23954  ORF Transcript_9930/g.23954 Transcript_9930/m.23954 type:complete len:279 (-) Transcript_9930:1915-2751(-)
MISTSRPRGGSERLRASLSKSPASSSSLLVWLALPSVTRRFLYSPPSRCSTAHTFTSSASSSLPSLSTSTETRTSLRSTGGGGLLGLPPTQLCATSWGAKRQRATTRGLTSSGGMSCSRRPWGRYHPGFRIDPQALQRGFRPFRSPASTALSPPTGATPPCCAASPSSSAREPLSRPSSSWTGPTPPTCARSRRSNATPPTLWYASSRCPRTKGPAPRAIGASRSRLAITPCYLTTMLCRTPTSLKPMWEPSSGTLAPQRSLSGAPPSPRLARGCSVR